MTNKKRALSDCAGSGSASQTRRKKINTAAAADTAPDNNYCIQCGEPALKVDSISCVICNLHHHLACCGWQSSISSDELNFLKEIGWICPPCQDGAKESYSTLQIQQSKLAAEIIKLQQQITTLQSKSFAESTEIEVDDSHDIDMGGAWEAVGAKGKHKAGTVGGLGKKSRTYLSVAAQSPSVAAQSFTTTSRIEATQPAPTIASLVVKTVNDMNRRKFNVVISGLAETNSEKSDTDLFTEVCEKFMFLHPAPLSSARLGKRSTPQSPHSRPRLLRVTFATELEVAELLKSAKKFRDADVAEVRMGVFLNKDITKEEALALFEKREARRKRSTTASAGTSSTLSAAARPFTPPVSDRQTDKEKRSASTSSGAAVPTVPLLPSTSISSTVSYIPSTVSTAVPNHSQLLASTNENRSLPVPVDAASVHTASCSQLSEANAATCNNNSQQMHALQLHKTQLEQAGNASA